MAQLHKSVLFSLLLSSVSLYISATSPRRFCPQASPGIYCLPYRVGWFECKAGSDHEKRPENHFCNENKPVNSPPLHCSCGFNRRCDDDQPTCIPIKEIPEIPKTFTVQFYGGKYISTPHGKKHYIITGIVYQDNENGNCRLTKIVHGYATIIIIIQKDKTLDLWKKYTHIRYHGSKKEECKITYKAYFPEYFEILRHFSYRNKKTHSEWTYKEGPLHSNDKFKIERWFLSRVHVGNDLGKFYYFPKEYINYKHGSAGAKHNEKTKIYYYSVQHRKPAEAWFRIPGKWQCAGKSLFNDQQDITPKSNLLQQKSDVYKTVSEDKISDLDEIDLEEFH